MKASESKRKLAKEGENKRKQAKTNPSKPPWTTMNHGEHGEPPREEPRENGNE